MGRSLKFNIFRYNPLDRNSVPHSDTFSVEETDSMTLFIALTRIRKEQDPSLQFDFCCRAGICGSCAMIINGRPDLACKTLTKELPTEITLMPLPVFKLIGDLSVDTGTWFRSMNEKMGSWIHTDKTLDPNAEEEKMVQRLGRGDLRIGALRGMWLLCGIMRHSQHEGGFRWSRCPEPYCPLHVRPERSAEGEGIFRGYRYG